MPCPNCKGKEIFDFLKRDSEIERILDLKKCNDCNCVFLEFNFNDNDLVAAG